MSENPPLTPKVDLLSTNHLKKQIVGQQIVNVTYYECNDLDQQFTYGAFDYFDYGILIEFKSGLILPVAWGAEEIETSIIHEQVPEFISDPDYLTFEANYQWSDYLNRTIVDFKLDYVNEKWHIPTRIRLYFDDSEVVTIILGEEIERNYIVPSPLKYVQAAYYYIFFKDEYEDFELLELKVYENPIHRKTGKRATNLNNQSIVGIIMVVIALILSGMYYWFDPLKIFNK